MYTEILAIQYIIKCIHRSTYIQHTQTIYYYASIYCNTQFITYYIHISCTVHLYTMIKRQPSTLRRLVVFIRRDPTSVSPSSSISSASWQKIHRNSWDGFHLTSLETISKHTQSYRKPIKMISFYVLERILIIHIILIIHRVTGQPPQKLPFWVGSFWHFSALQRPRAGCGFRLLHTGVSKNRAEPQNEWWKS